MKNYDTFPTPHMRGAVQRWIESAILPGSFLTAVITNDLKDACACADDLNREKLFEIVMWFWNEAPVGSWGSPNSIDVWKGSINA